MKRFPGFSRGRTLGAALALSVLLPLLPTTLHRPSNAQDGPPPYPPRPALGGTRGPSAFLFDREGATAYVAEQDTGQVAVLDMQSGKARAHIPTGGKEPTGLAWLEGDRTLAV